MTSNEKAPYPPKIVCLSLRTVFVQSEVAAYLVRPDVLQAWLGKSAKLQPKVGSSVVLPLPGFPPGTSIHKPPIKGVVTAENWSTNLSKDGKDAFYLSIALDGEDDQASGPTIGIRVVPTPGGSKVKIKHSGLQSQEVRRASVRAWQHVLNRLGKLLTNVYHARRRKRQAVVIVHGVGEQRPGQTLRKFLDSIFPGIRASGKCYLRPDYDSNLFEMRRATVPGYRGERPRTDVYELYWAHLIRDTTIGQVYRWMGKLLVAPARNIPSTLKKHIWVMRIFPLIAIAIAAWWMADGSRSVSLQGATAAAGVIAILPSVLWVVWHFFRDQFLLGFAGDAARYLEPKPGNISIRQQIREEGVDLLDRLHEPGRYDRIIVYGHSLGSVIAYDILSHLWALLSRQRAENQQMSSKQLLAVENLLNPRPDHTAEATVEVARDRQHAAWQEYRRNGFEWLVSDFVTAGSPLAHARWLLNLDKHTQFDDLVEERSLPTCPPKPEISKSPRPGHTRKTLTFTHAYRDTSNPARKRSRSVQVPHHAGLFALTRWSNLYFPFTGLARGDPIGGPLKDTFGAWIKDIELPHPGKGILGFAHTWYTERRGDGHHVERLKEALALSYGSGLEDPLHDIRISEAN